jgi:riboflavin transporter FmnP
MKATFTTKKIVTMALLSALSIILVFYIHFPLFPAAPYLEYDPADIPIFIGTIALGPILGIILTVVTAILQGITVSNASGIIGIIMHIFATGSFVLVLGLITKKADLNNKRLIFGLFLGIITMTTSMALWNLIFTPIFLNVDRNVVVKLLPIIISFNLIKSIVNSIIAFIIYKSLHKYI